MTATTLRTAELVPGGERLPAWRRLAFARLLPGRVVVYAWLLAGSPIAVLQLDHAHLRELNALPPVIHWFRDTALAAPAAAVAVAAAVVVATWIRPADPGGRGSLRSAALWGVVAAALFAVLAVPLAQVHAVVFGTSAEAGIDPLEHALEEGLISFQAALVVVPVALLAGVPWRGAEHPGGRPGGRTAEPGSIRVGGDR